MRSVGHRDTEFREPQLPPLMPKPRRQNSAPTSTYPTCQSKRSCLTPKRHIAKRVMENEAYSTGRIELRILTERHTETDNEREHHRPN